MVVTIALSFFEAFIHTAGIAIHRMKKPYTPGLVTAWLLAIAAVFAIVQLNANGLVSAGGYVAGSVIMLVSYICLDLFIILGFGEKRKDIFNMIRSQLENKET